VLFFIIDKLSLLAWPDEMASRVVVWRSFLQKAMTVKFVFFRPKVLRNCGVTRRSRMFGHSSINILPNHSAGKLFTSPASSACLNFFSEDVDIFLYRLTQSTFVNDFFTKQPLQLYY